MKFYKLCDPEGPHKNLPTVQWDPKNSRPLFEFVRTNVRGVLEYETSNPEMISLLRAAGYSEEMPQGIGNINQMGMAGPVPEGTELPLPQLTEQTKDSLRRFTKK